jgi:hypothetical protein
MKRLHLAGLVLLVAACSADSISSSPSQPSSAARSPSVTTPAPFDSVNTPSPDAPFTAWPSTPAAAAPRYEDVPGIAPPPAYLGRPDGTYVPTLQGSYEWSEGNESADVLGVLKGYIDRGGLPPPALETMRVAALTLPQPHRMDQWHISVGPWIGEAWMPNASASLEGAGGTLRVEGSGDPTSAVCFNAPAGDHFITGFFHSPDGGQSTVYGRVTVKP